MSIGLSRISGADLELLLEGDEDAEERARDPTGGLDLDKFWHQVHYMVCGDVNPVGSGAGLAVMGGEPVDPDDEASLLYLTPAQVSAIAADLAHLPDKVVRERAAAEMPEEIDRTSGWSDQERAEILWGLFEKLRAFYAKTSQLGQAVVIEIF